MRSDHLYNVPTGIPMPQDDGAARHLLRKKVPSIALACTNGQPVNGVSYHN